MARICSYTKNSLAIPGNGNKVLVYKFIKQWIQKILSFLSPFYCNWKVQTPNPGVQHFLALFKLSNHLCSKFAKISHMGCAQTFKVPALSRASPPSGMTLINSCIKIVYYYAFSKNERSFLTWKAPIWKGNKYSPENLNLIPKGDLCGRCLSFIIPLKDTTYNLSRNAVNTGENFWNVIMTNQIRDGTAKKITAKPQLSHDLTRNNELALSSILPFTNTEIFLSRFRLWYPQGIDIKNILRKSDVKYQSIRHS